jgi:hypothetical protein
MNMNIPTLNASALIRELSSGRTKPCLFHCEYDNIELGAEYVVKLKAGIDSKETGLASELIASQLAIFLDIPTPEPAIINLDPSLADIISDPVLSQKIRDSAGANFGSKYISPGFETWPVGKSIPSSLKQLALEIFAFDALIQNPDRRIDKPNILWKKDELYILDHELGFSFIFNVLPSGQPWQISNLEFIQKHLFYLPLKAQPVDLDRFIGAMEGLKDEKLDSIIQNIPNAWHNIHASKIRNHLSEVSRHINEFVDEIRRVLL